MASSKTTRDYTRRLTTPTICIRLAGTGKELHLHRGRLEAKSVYFKRLLSSPWSENVENSLTLQLAPHACRAFHAIAEFMYTDAYEPSGDSLPEKCIEAASVYVLADRFTILDLKAIALLRLKGFFGPEQRHMLPVSGPSPQAESIYIPPTKKRIGGDARIFSHEHIRLTKEILYDTMDEIAEENESHEANPVSTDMSSSKQSANDAAMSTDKDLFEPISQDSSYSDPRRDAQRVFSEYMVAQLPELRYSEGFKTLLRTGVLEGPFLHDLLCANL